MCWKPALEQWTCLPAAAVPSVNEFQQMLDLKGDFFASGLELISHKENTILQGQEMTPVRLNALQMFVAQSQSRDCLLTRPGSEFEGDTEGDWRKMLYPRKPCACGHTSDAIG